MNENTRLPGTSPSVTTFYGSESRRHIGALLGPRGAPLARVSPPWLQWGSLSRHRTQGGLVATKASASPPQAKAPPMGTFPPVRDGLTTPKSPGTAPSDPEEADGPSMAGPGPGRLVPASGRRLIGDPMCPYNSMERDMVAMVRDMGGEARTALAAFIRSMGPLVRASSDPRNPGDNRPRRAGPPPGLRCRAWRPCPRGLCSRV